MCRLSLIVACALLVSALSYADETTYQIKFTDITREAGLEKSGPSFGIAVADYDKDGYVDMAISNHGYVTLHHNEQDGTFRDVTSIGNFERGLDTHGVTWVDYDSDGWLDLYISCGANRGMGLGNANRVLMNRKGRKFERVELGTLLDDSQGAARASCPTDFDNDGDIDLILMNFLRPGRGQHIALKTDHGYKDIAETVGWSERQASSVRIINIDDSGKPVYVLQTGGAEGGAIFKRGENDVFENVSETLGVVPGYQVQSVIPFDYDNDGDLDLYYVLGPNWITSPPEVRGKTLHFFYSGTPLNVIQGCRFKAEGRLRGTIYINNVPNAGMVKLGKAV